MNIAITILLVLYVGLAAAALYFIYQADREGAMRDKTESELDRQAIEKLVSDILDNRRLAVEIVSAWLDKNNYMLVPKKGDDNHD